MKSMKIRTKITLWFSVLFTVIFAIMFILILVINRYVLHTNVEESLKAAVINNRDEIEFTDDFEAEEVEPGDHYMEYRDGYLEIDDDFIAERRGIYTILLNPEGKILYGKPPVRLPVTEDGVVTGQKVEGESYYVYCLSLTGEHFEGLMLQGIVNEDAHETILTRTVNLSLLVLPLLVLAAVIGGYILAGTLLRPIRQIAGTAESINDGADLSRRIQLGKGADDLHQLAHSFNHMIDRLEHSFEAEKQFISDISHELRTPVSTILARTELTLAKERSADEYQRDLELIQRQAKRMKRLVNEMLQYSRLERMAVLSGKEEIHLSQLVEMVAEEQKLNSSRGIRLSYHVEPDIFIEGDTELLIRLLNNLISNAYRYGKQDGTIMVGLYEETDRVFLQVKDDGIGMDEEEKGKIFRRFYQADGARSSAHSLGLGLTIVSEIVRLHGAEITVESERGTGSEFTIIFKKN